MIIRVPIVASDPPDQHGYPPPRALPASAWALLVAFFLALLLGSVLMFPKYLVDRTITLGRAQPPAIADRLKAENDVRSTLLQGLGALVLLAGAITTWRQLQATLERNRAELHLSQEGQITERFTRAIEQLGNETLAIRLGGIYALERIARDSPVDHGPIMEVLTAFVRERALWKGDQLLAEQTQPQEPPADIQAILTVLGRRVIHKNWREPARLDLSRTDLRWIWGGAALMRVSFFRAHLEGAHLGEAHLEGADLGEAHLEEADLGGAHLEKADLTEADLEAAHLVDAHLEGAFLNGARLEKANLIDAHLEGAFLSRANLKEADLRGACLEGADLVKAHLEGAHLNGALLRRAKLREADLRGADLAEMELYKGADLDGAQLNGADLDGANLAGAYLNKIHLEEARGLTREQIASARI